MSEEKFPGFADYKEWFRKQPQFSQKVDDFIILRFLHSCYYDVEKAKKAAETYYSMRASGYTIFKDRDPLQTDVQTAMQYSKMAHYPISGNRRLWIWQVDDPGLYRYNVFHEAKLSMMVLDAWLLTDRTLQESDIMIACMKHASFKMIMKMNITLSKTLSKYYEEAAPFRMNQIHFINCSSIMNRIYSLYETFIDSEISNKIRFHPPNSEALYEFISKDELPKELGGNRESMEHFTQIIIDNVMDQRDKLQDDSYWFNSNYNEKRK